MTAPLSAWPGELLLLESAFEQAPIGMGVFDAEGRYLRVNRALCRVLGRAREELLGKLYRDVFHPDDLAADAAQMDRLVRGDVAAYEGECRRVRPDGSVVWVQERVSAARNTVGIALGEDGPGRPGYVIRQLVDVTEQLQLTAALEEARREAVAADRAKTEFLSRVSHELRTPLTAILGFTELIGADRPLTASGELAQIAVAGRHLLGLVDDLLDLARIEEGRLVLASEPVTVAEVIAEVAAMVRRGALTAGLKMVVEALPHYDQAVRADHRRVVQVLLNLLDNAVKFSSEGGEVRLSVRSGGGRVRITVIDTGPGLTADQQRRLFVPFERLGAEQREVPGTGLGLALSRALAEAMDGELVVESAPGQGSSFTLSLPAAEAPLPGEEVEVVAPVWSGARHGVLVGRRWGVLYVEDCPFSGRLVEAILARYTDVELVIATTGREALQLAASRPPDLVLLDLGLPDLAGVEVLADLRASPATAGVPVVVVTADVAPARPEELLEAGAQAFLTKPIAVRSLLDTLADLLAERLARMP